jgi:two-component system response regulator FixJ
LRELVHIVDDDELVRGTVSHLLANHGYLTQIYSGGAEFLRDCTLERGCILLDLNMPPMSGYDVLEALARQDCGLPVVVMSAFGDPPDVVRALKLGAIDFVEKPFNARTLFGAVDQALASFGKSEIRRAITAAAVARLNCLSSREREILQGLVDGLSNKGIARRLGLSPRTIEMHRASMKGELGVKSLSEAVQFAIDAELTPLHRAG